jgi:hypothetical protein
MVSFTKVFVITSGSHFPFRKPKGEREGLAC